MQYQKDSEVHYLDKYKITNDFVLNLIIFLIGFWNLNIFIKLILNLALLLFKAGY